MPQPGTRFQYQTRPRLGFAICLPLLLLSLTVAHSAIPEAGFRTHVTPQTLRFTTPTPGFNPDNPDQEMGTFQPGITVRVVEVDPHHPHYWRVAFDRPGAEPLIALIQIPIISTIGGRGWQESENLLAGFPLLDRLLRHPNPWSEELRKSPGEILSQSFMVEPGATPPYGRFFCAELNKNTAWNLLPLHVVFDISSAERPKYIIEFWSKGEAFRVRDFRGEPERNLLRRNLSQLATFFDPSGNSVQRERGSNRYIRGLRDNVEYFHLPNDLRVALHFHHGEFLFIEIEQASAAARAQTIVRSPAELAKHLQEQVTWRDDRIRYISNIPMINQGQTSYCVPATMARVLQFYGYDVHTHALAMLTKTIEQRSMEDGGTTLADMQRAMRRITDGSPFRLRELTDNRAETIRQAIDSGLPIVWLIQGHLRLLIGISDTGNEIVYTDSWGPGHDFKTMYFSQFTSENRGMWVLEPR
jgi:hypothetical protein